MDSVIPASPQSFIILAKGNLHKILVVLFVYILCLKLFPSKESSGFLSWWQNALFSGFNNPPVFYSSKYASIFLSLYLFDSRQLCRQFQVVMQIGLLLPYPQTCKNKLDRTLSNEEERFILGGLNSLIRVNILPWFTGFSSLLAVTFSHVQRQTWKETHYRGCLTILCRWSFWRN